MNNCDNIIKYHGQSRNLDQNRIYHNNQNENDKNNWNLHEYWTILRQVYQTLHQIILSNNTSDDPSDLSPITAFHLTIDLM